jgi:hypothetical protein
MKNLNHPISIYKTSYLDFCVKRGYDYLVNFQTIYRAKLDMGPVPMDISGDI